MYQLAEKMLYHTENWSDHLSSKHTTLKLNFILETNTSIQIET